MELGNIVQFTSKLNDLGCARRLCCLIGGLVWLGVIGSLSLLLVAVPLAVEPAVATLLESFSRQPMVCVTAAVKTGMAVGGQGDACSWTSCRQGCTGENQLEVGHVKFFCCFHVFFCDHTIIIIESYWQAPSISLQISLILRNVGIHTFLTYSFIHSISSIFIYLFFTI